MLVKVVKIKTEYITLGQLLKYADIIPSGGYEKIFIQENSILVNGEEEKRRGRKLRKGDSVKIDKLEILIDSENVD